MSDTALSTVSLPTAIGQAPAPKRILTAKMRKDLKRVLIKDMLPALYHEYESSAAPVLEMHYRIAVAKQ